VWGEWATEYGWVGNRVTLERYGARIVARRRSFEYMFYIHIGKQASKRIVLFFIILSLTLALFCYVGGCLNFCSEVILWHLFTHSTFWAG